MNLQISKFDNTQSKIYKYMYIFT